MEEPFAELGYCPKCSTAIIEALNKLVCPRADSEGHAWLPDVFCNKCGFRYEHCLCL